MWDKLIEIASSVGPWLAANQGSILTIAGFVLVFIAKVFPNANAGKFIGGIQLAVDLAARLCFALGAALKALADLLGNLLKSDGILGKK